MNQKIEILLVEDSETQALQFQLLLRRAGYHVNVVHDGIEGWTSACDRSPGLILLDIDLPGMNGFQVLSRLKRGRSTSTIPVLMLTNRDHVSDVERAITLGADDYLFKDDCLTSHQSAELLCSAVRQLIAPKEVMTA